MILREQSQLILPRRDNPEIFNPDRWDTERVKNRGRTEYMP